MFDVGDVLVLTFGNCVLTTGVIKWFSRLSAYVFNGFFSSKSKIHDFNVF